MLRKILLDKENHFQTLLDQIQTSLDSETKLAESQLLIEQMRRVKETVSSTTEWLKQGFPERGFELQGGATCYLDAVGHLVYGWMWLLMLESLSEDNSNEFKARKKVAAEFYALHLLPNAIEACRRVKQGFKSFVELDDSLI